MTEHVDVTLAKLRAIVGGANPAATLDQMVELFEGLDRTLSNGGLLPIGWCGTADPWDGETLEAWTARVAVFYDNRPFRPLEETEHDHAEDK